jgi:hypothetical protein
MSDAIVHRRGVGVDPAATDAQAQIVVLQQYFIAAMSTTPPTTAQLAQAQVALGALAVDVQALSTALDACMAGRTITPTPTSTPANPTPGPGVWVSGTAATFMTAGAAGLGGVFGWWLGSKKRTR